MSKKKYALCGAGIALVLMLMAMFALGGGYGSGFPAFIFFGPLIVFLAPIEYLSEGFNFNDLPPDIRDLLSLLLVLIGVFLYMAYALLLRWGIRKRKGPNVLLAILSFHFVALVFSHIAEGSDFDGMQKLWSRSQIYTMGVFVPFVLAIMLACYVVWKPRTDLNDYGYCGECDYNLTGNRSGVCPECGTTIPSGQVKLLAEKSPESEAATR